MIIFSTFIQISGSFVSLRISLARSRPKCHWNKANILNDLRASRCYVVDVYIVTGVIDFKKREERRIKATVYLLSYLCEDRMH